MSQHDFPELKNDRILRVCRGDVPDRLPVWIMRQAGRYMEEFREFRKHHTFFDICEKPELASEVTLMPLKKFDLDAAIIFSDILVIPRALGLPVEMKPSVGPVLPKPLTLATMDTLKIDGIMDRLKFVGEAITLTRHKLKGRVPLIGFAGAPWTLMAYMIEGGGSKTFSNAKKWLYAFPIEAISVMKQLTDIIIDFLVMQVECGAQLLQVFDSHAEVLNKHMYMSFCMYPLKRIRLEVNQKLAERNLEPVPMILFAKGAHYCLPELANLGYEVLSIDWTIEPSVARALRDIHENLILQGNLDPCALYSNKEDLIRHVLDMVQGFGTKKYIVNLGHGIYPDVDEAAVEILLEVIRGIEVAE